MLIFILTDVHCSQKSVLSFEKGSNCPIKSPDPPTTTTTTPATTPFCYLQNPGGSAQYLFKTIFANNS